MKYNIIALNRDLEATQADNASLVKRLADSEAALDTVRKEADTLKETNISLTKQVDALKAENEVVNNSANAQAAQIVATLGVPTDAVKESVAATEPDVFAQFAALTGKDRSAFYAKHRAAILRASGLKK